MISEVEKAGRVREAENQLLERRRMLERQNLAEEREVARMLDLLQEERGKDRRLMQDLTRSETELEVRPLIHRCEADPRELRASCDVSPVRSHACMS
jgi:hypothetical protein